MNNTEKIFGIFRNSQKFEKNAKAFIDTTFQSKSNPVQIIY